LFLIKIGLRYTDMRDRILYLCPAALKKKLQVDSFKGTSLRARAVLMSDIYRPSDLSGEPSCGVPSASLLVLVLLFLVPIYLTSVTTEMMKSNL
jgi:hypothetical protein